MKRKVNYDDILSADRARKQFEDCMDKFVADWNHCSIRKARKLRAAADREHRNLIKSQAAEAEKQFPAAIHKVIDHFKTASDTEKISVVWNLNHSVIYPS